MGKQVVYKGRPVVRDAMRILRRSPKFIILAEDENGKDMPLYCAGYGHESLVADQLLKVGVAMLRQHKAEMKRLAAEARAAAGLPPLEDVPAEAPVPEPEEGREVGYSGLVLPPGVEDVPAFGKPREGSA